MDEDRDDALGVVLSKWGVTDARTALEAKLRAGDKISDTGRGRRPEAGRYQRGPSKKKMTLQCGTE